MTSPLGRCMALAFALLVGATTGLAAPSGVETPSTVPAPVSPAPIPDSVVLDIALRTLAPDGRAGSARQLDTRAAEVRSYLTSMGGDGWFGSYQARFGVPKTVEEYKVSTLVGIRDSKLNHYYLHTRLVSPEILTALSCKVPDPTNRTSWAFCALAHWDGIIAFNNENSQVRFRALAQQLLDEQVDGRWEWQLAIPERNLRTPWISALTQSLGISVLIRAFQFTAETKYLEGARAALQWLARPLGKGGVAARLPVGTWYEEYPNQASPSHVLNGHMWALFGIWDFYRATGDAGARRLFDDGIRALENDLHRYDVSGWSVYSRENKVDFVSGAYQQFIVEQLRVLEVITKSRTLGSYRAIWECSLAHDALFVHTAAAEFNRARGLAVPTAAYPSYCARLASAEMYPTEAQRAVVRAASDSSARQQEVRAVIAWLPSVGGEQWFRNYAKQFGRPETSCVFEFHDGDLFGRSLPHYYLGHPVRDGKPVADPDCLISLGNQYGIADRFTTTMVAHVALSNWDSFLLTGNEDFRARFLEHAQLMRSRQAEGRWEWQIEIPTRGLKSPWISGMTQSLGVSVFLRAYQLTGDQDYLARATAAFKWLREPVSAGGVAIKTAAGTWYEEYPSAEAPSHVLNGHIWALFGIWDYFRATRDPGAARMFREGIDILKSQIHRYDIGHWVVYDQLNQVDVVNGFYVSFIVEQLKALHALTGDADFLRFATKWANYQQQHSLFGHMAFEEYAKATKGTAK